jgi:hypothetical protein
MKLTILFVVVVGAILICWLRSVPSDLYDRGRFLFAGFSVDGESRAALCVHPA